MRKEYNIVTDLDCRLDDRLGLGLVLRIPVTDWRRNSWI